MRSGALGKGTGCPTCALASNAQILPKKVRLMGGVAAGLKKIEARSTTRSASVLRYRHRGLSRQREDKRGGYGVCAADWAASRLLAIRNAGRRARNPGVRG